jgi:DNA replication protein DnaD
LAQGWIKLHRKIKHCYLWQDNEPFDKRSAWIDLILNANHADNKTLINNQLVLVKRGEFITSEVKLSERWKWDRGKVRRFLKLLETDNMILKTATSRLYITIEIINYDEYQDTTSNTTSESVDIAGIQDNDEQVKQQVTNKRATSNEQVTNINKNEEECIKNDKENNMSAEQTPYEEIKKIFNEICVTLPKIKSLTDARKNTLKTRWKENSSLKFFEELFCMVNESSFLSGRDDRWKGCSFDWIIKPSNMQKILEGNYANKKVSNMEDWRL